MEEASINWRIKQVRSALNLNQREFSRQLALSDGYIGGVEADVRQVNGRLVKLIAAEFGVNERWLRTGEGEMFALPDLDEKSARLLSVFNSLPPKYQDLVLGIVELLRASGEEPPRPSPPAPPGRTA